MQKIDKSKRNATAYKEWEEKLEIENKPHPKYNSSNGEFYLDIVMDLFSCQKGLCAYTEKRLCNEKHLTSEHWEKGCYTSIKPDFTGQLEHFDESLKAKKKDTNGKKSWLWNNFLMVDSDINTKVKGSKSIDDILKPDKADYEPFELLDYDLETHRFTANDGNMNLSNEEKERIKKMIETLGLNFGPILDQRKDLLAEVRDRIDFGMETNATSTGEFPTAFQFFILENS
jgi:hypothetical protein